MSSSTTTYDEHVRQWRRQDDTYRAALTEWARLNGLVERPKGRGWCGHHLLGQRPSYSHAPGCPSTHGGRWWDHARGFGDGRHPTAILGFPYGEPSRIATAVADYATRLGLPHHVGDARGPLSLYFWGLATPWLIAAPGRDVAAMFVVSSPALDVAVGEARRYAAMRGVS